MAMPAPVLLAEVRRRKADRRSEADELRMEVRAAGQEMKATATFIANALLGPREPDIRSAVYAAGRLWTLGHSYTDPEPEGAAA